MTSLPKIIISAPSGAGKTTLVKRLMQKIPRLGFSVSCTTRSPRTNEIHGIDYYFISLEEFKKKIEENAFVEYEEVYENQYYGTLHSELERLYNEGKIPVFDVDVKGGIRLKELFGKEALSVFIAPPSLQTLKERLTNRNTETPESLKRRVQKAEEELQYQSKFDAVVVNDDLELSSDKLVQLVGNFLKHATVLR